MNMYLHELKAYRKSTIIWTTSLVLIIILFLSMFPAFSKDTADFKKLLEGYPEALRKAIGLSLDNVFTLLGFYSYIFLYILLCGSIQAMHLGISILNFLCLLSFSVLIFSNLIIFPSLMIATL